MSQPVTTYTLVGKKTRGIQVTLGLLLVVGGFMAYRVVSDFSNELERATGAGKVVVVGMPVVLPMLVGALLLFPYRYSLNERGLRVECVLSKRSVLFADVDSAVLEMVPNQKRPTERLVLTTAGKKVHISAALTEGYEQLRDAVLASVSQSIIEDRRGAQETG